MKATGALLRGKGLQWEIATIDVDDPRQNELLIRVVASGLCHSDDHYVTGDFPSEIWPICAGHEGSGVVEHVGPHTPGWGVGDHVVMQFIPSCGKCRFCAMGRQNLCGAGARTNKGNREDGSFRITENGKQVAQMAGISTFANYSVVDVMSVVKIGKDIPLEKACLVGCGVATGYGSAINSARIEGGDTVIVMGIGGIGINAVQGASHSGAMNVVAVDPVQFKREKAMEFGATHAFASIEEATAFAQSVTDGQGADSTIVCVGQTTGDHIAQGFDSIRKGGTVVMTGVSDVMKVGIPVSPSMMTLYQKRLQGSLYGEMSPPKDIPRLLALYQAGQLNLDDLVSRTYKLAEINQGYADMHAGINLRGVVIHEH
jgi:NDMA-dependent alcohol dehydrogenase